MENYFYKLLNEPYCINYKINYYNDYGNSYLIYIIDKGKYNNNYYCINYLK